MFNLHAIAYKITFLVTGKIDITIQSFHQDIGVCIENCVKLNNISFLTVVNTMTTYTNSIKALVCSAVTVKMLRDKFFIVRYNHNL